ncbi:hypothetical protein [Faecalispora jeddahensis]|uniref:hypothetical protein n=1 Tax=Faecalispora jeddahensis TaxID=1414721 RepID=UPI001898AF2A|nr:hypothetical protein [Faecalispora jeddahensis]
MAETSGFFASVSGDRKYNTDFLARWVASIISNGVYNGDLGVTAGGSSMAITLPAGRAWINGYHYRNDAAITLPIANADGVLNRKDTIVLRWDVNERSITAQVIKGTFASSPTAPAITRSAEQYDLKLAEISIPAGTTAITQALITDTRLDTAVCGIVTGVIDQVDTTTFYNQIAADLAQFKSTQQADFEVWFDSIKDILDDNTAGNLLNLINDHKADTAAHITTALHTRTGTVNNLAVPDGAKNLTFLAAATIADGDSWTVNSQPVTAKLQNGEALPGELFKSGCWVTGVRLSDDGTQLFFRAGAATVPSIFGNGSDGDAVISSSTTLPVPVEHQSIIEKQYKSLTINAGVTFKCAAFNAGLIIRVKGDCTIHGTIDQSGLAPKTNSQNTYAYPSQLVCGNGGNGGNGGAGYNRTPPVGGTGMLRRAYGGGYGGGAAGGSSNSYYEDNVYYEGGIGGSSTGTTIETYSLFRGGPTSTSAGGNAGSYGGGGSGAGTSNSSASGGSGGDGGGGNGNAGTYVKSGNWSYYGGGGGGAGNYGGGVILLYVGGNLIIDGYLKANGLNGGNGGANASTNFILCGGGGGGGGGGGAIYIYYKGSYSNTGIMQVNGGSGGSRGGVGGTGSGTPSVVGAAGTVGSITVIQHTN